MTAPAGHKQSQPQNLASVHVLKHDNLSTPLQCQMHSSGCWRKSSKLFAAGNSFASDVPALYESCASRQSGSTSLQFMLCGLYPLHRQDKPTARLHDMKPHGCNRDPVCTKSTLLTTSSSMPRRKFAHNLRSSKQKAALVPSLTSSPQPAADASNHSARAAFAAVPKH